MAFEVPVTVKVTSLPGQSAGPLVPEIVAAAKAFTVIAILFEVAGEPTKQGVALDVISTVTTSPLAKAVVVKIALSVPTLFPFTFHWYEGVVPPFVGVAVKVTEVPKQIVVAVETIATEATVEGVTVTVTAFEYATGRAPF